MGGPEPQDMAQVCEGAPPYRNPLSLGPKAQGSTPQVIVKVIGSARPPLRRQTNARYTPLTALKAMDPSGSLYVQTSHRLLFRWPRLLNLGLRCLACSCFRTPVWPR